jgi:hypothetical protein
MASTDRHRVDGKFTQKTKLKKQRGSYDSGKSVG